MRAPPRALLPGLLVTLAVALGVALERGNDRSRLPDIVLVIVDTLRADRVGWYGGTRGLTPTLDELASRSDVFWNAYAVSSWTSPSVASVLTGRAPTDHRVRGFTSVLADEELTLAEILRTHGYRSAALQGNPLVDRKLGFAQGFETYKVGRLGARTRVKYRAGRLNRAAFAWLDRRARGDRAPVFLFFQYMEAHPPYTVKPWRVRRLLTERRRSDTAAARAIEFLDPTRQWDVFLEPSAWSRLDATTLGALEDVYDAEVASVDAGLRNLFHGLAERGLLDDAIIVVLADHGEEFGEHGRLGHGFTLYNEVLRVPLLVHAPGQQVRHDVHDVVSLLDVAPTILRLAGIHAPSTFAGRSMIDAPPGHATAELHRPRREMIADPAHRRAAVVGAQKVIVDTHGQREGYDLASDPGERRRVEPADAALAMIADEDAPPATQEPPSLDDETRRRLEALGYLGAR